MHTILQLNGCLSQLQQTKTLLQHRYAYIPYVWCSYLQRDQFKLANCVQRHGALSCWGLEVSMASEYAFQASFRHLGARDATLSMSARFSKSLPCGASLFCSGSWGMWRVFAGATLWALSSEALFSIALAGFQILPWRDHLAT